VPPPGWKACTLLRVLRVLIINISPFLPRAEVFSMTSVTEAACQPPSHSLVEAALPAVSLLTPALPCLAHSTSCSLHVSAHTVSLLTPALPVSGHSESLFTLCLSSHLPCPVSAHTKSLLTPALPCLAHSSSCSLHVSARALSLLTPALPCLWSHYVFAHTCLLCLRSCPCPTGMTPTSQAPCATSSSTTCASRCWVLVVLVSLAWCSLSLQV